MPIINPGGARHWSEAFVEHLRTVHLALVSVSVGIVFVIASSKPYDPARALIEVRQILQLQKDWSPTWVLANLRTRLVQTAVSKEMPDQIFAMTLGQPFECELTGPNIKRGRVFNCVAHQDWVEPVNRYKREIPFTTSYGQRGRLLPTFSVTTFPTTFWQFRAWWDVLLRDVKSISFAHVIADGTVKGPNPNENWVRYDDEASASPRVAPIDLRLNLTPAGGAYEGKIDGDKTTITLPVVAVEECDIDRAALKKIFPDWGTGAFGEAFPDLAKALGSFYEVSIEDMKDRLAQEAGKGEESFEVFGLKIPVGQLTTWGALTLLSLQVYFYLHLKELFKKLGVDDPGWDIPWIVMYQSRMSKALSLLSCCLIPTLVVGLLAFYSISSTLRDVSISWSILGGQKLLLFWMSCFCVAVVASGWLSILSWKYRPRIAAAVELRK
jgi:hypothetical protein